MVSPSSNPRSRKTSNHFHPPMRSSPILSHPTWNLWRSNPLLFKLMLAHVYGSLSNISWRPRASGLNKQYTGRTQSPGTPFFLVSAVSAALLSSPVRPPGASLPPGALPEPSTWFPCSGSVLAHGGSQSDTPQHRIPVLQHPGWVNLGKWLYPPSPSSLVSGWREYNRIVRHERRQRVCLGLCLVH